VAPSADTILKRVDERLSDVRAEIARLEAARDALVRAPRRRRREPTRRSGRSKSPRLPARPTGDAFSGDIAGDAPQAFGDIGGDAPQAFGDIGGE
jgi:hypothetical protein